MDVLRQSSTAATASAAASGAATRASYRAPTNTSAAPAAPVANSRSNIAAASSGVAGAAGAFSARRPPPRPRSAAATGATLPASAGAAAAAIPTTTRIGGTVNGMTGDRVVGGAALGQPTVLATRSMNSTGNSSSSGVDAIVPEPVGHAAFHSHGTPAPSSASTDPSLSTTADVGPMLVAAAQPPLPSVHATSIGVSAAGVSATVAFSPTAATVSLSGGSEAEAAREACAHALMMLGLWLRLLRYSAPGTFRTRALSCLIPCLMLMCLI